MPNAYKVLGQVNPAANTDTTLATVGSGKSWVCSTLTICNEGGSQTTFRVAVRPAGATLDPKHYIAYDAVVEGNDMVALTLGLTLAATDVVTVRAGTANVAFNLFGNEIS